MSQNLPPAITPAPAAETASHSARPGDVYATLQVKLRETFLSDGPRALLSMREQLKNFLKSADRASAQTQLVGLYQTLHALDGNAVISGFDRVAQMAGALATLAKVLYERPNGINPSTIRTLTHTVDFLSPLLETSVQYQVPRSASPIVLVIDDEPIIGSLVCAALEPSGLRALGVSESGVALKLLEQNPVDLIFLDIGMPGIDGFEVCSRLRAVPLHTETPVVFLTGLADFENRARSVLKGGNDLIAKPFLPAELTVKALTYVFKSQLRLPKKPTATADISNALRTIE